MGFAQPSAQAGLVCVRLDYWPQVTADVTDAAVKAKCPVNGTIVGILGRARAIGGGTPFTDVDVEVLKNNDALLSANLPVVDASALTAGGTWGSLSATLATLRVVVDDVLRIKLVDVTGGATSPTLDGLTIEIWIARN